MPTEGTPAFNAISILEIHEIDYRSGQPGLTATAAYINTRNGKTYGQTTLKNCWTKETLILLEQLRTSMERDMAVLVFEEGPVAMISKGALDLKGTAVRDVSGKLIGIGEELASEAPSI